MPTRIMRITIDVAVDTDTDTDTDGSWDVEASWNGCESSPSTVDEYSEHEHHDNYLDEYSDDYSDGYSDRYSDDDDESNNGYLRNTASHKTRVPSTISVVDVLPGLFKHGLTCAAVTMILNLGLILGLISDDGWPMSVLLFFFSKTVAGAFAGFALVLTDMAYRLLKHDNLKSPEWLLQLAVLCVEGMVLVTGLYLAGRPQNLAVLVLGWLLESAVSARIGWIGWQDSNDGHFSSIFPLKDWAPTKISIMEAALSQVQHGITCCCFANTLNLGLALHFISVDGWLMRLLLLLLTKAGASAAAGGVLVTTGITYGLWSGDLHDLQTSKWLLQLVVLCVEGLALVAGLSWSFAVTRQHQNPAVFILAWLLESATLGAAESRALTLKALFRALKTLRFRHVML